MIPNEFSLVEAARKISLGELTSEALVSSALDRIASREADLHAWSHLDGERALAEARSVDADKVKGPLAGVPIGVKDVIDVCGMPTGMGSPIYDGYMPKADAACVSALRAAGAIVLGKTVTAEFAGVASGPTRHPLSPAHTPGGSSSGSAAAVADNMVPFAFATQTAGSTLRPSSYCGLVGFKPTYNQISRVGLKFSAETLDTIGLIARELDDVALVWRLLVNRQASSVDIGRLKPRFAVFKTHQWHRARPETQMAVDSTTERLKSAGSLVDEVSVPDGFDQLSEARRTINNYERARALMWEHREHRSEISPALLALLDDGCKIPHEQYLKAIGHAAMWRTWLDHFFDRYDAILTASADGEAPLGLQYTGSPAFQEIWTMLHAPAVTLPLAKGPSGLPVGVQLIGKRFADESLISVAGWVMKLNG